MTMTLREFLLAASFGAIIAGVYLFVTSEQFNKKPHVYRSGVSVHSMDA